MKTLKFVLLFNLFFYTSILFTIITSALFAYQLDFDSFEELLLRFHKALPIIFIIINSALLLIRISEIVTVWSWKFVNNIVLKGKNYKESTNSIDLSYSGSI